MKLFRLVAAALCASCLLSPLLAQAQRSSAGVYKGTVINNGPVIYLTVEGTLGIQGYAVDSVNKKIGVARGAILNSSFSLSLSNGATLTGSFSADGTQASGTYVANGSTLTYSAPRIAFRTAGSAVGGLYDGTSYPEGQSAATGARGRNLFIGIDQDNQLILVETTVSGGAASFAGGVGSVAADGNTGDYTISIPSPAGSTTPITGRFTTSGGRLDGTYTTSAGTSDFNVFKVRLANRLVNLSTRGFVNTGAGQLIGGFVVAGGPREVVIVARGPSLAAAGVSPVLADPKVQLMRGQTVIAENDNWKTNAQSPALALFSFLGALQDSESVISIVLEPGAYTAIVSGAGGTTGIALIEIYEIGWE